MGELSRDIRALARDVAALRVEFEEYRTELREVLDRFLREVPGPRPTPTRELGPAVKAYRAHRDDLGALSAPSAGRAMTCGCYGPG